MAESVRHVWGLSLSHVAVVHNAMLQLTDAAARSSEQHEGIGKSRTKQDHQDCPKFLNWLTLRNPFLIPDDNLHSLSSSIVPIRGKDNVNCERAESIGIQIQAVLDNTVYNNTSINQKDQIKTLRFLQHSNTVSQTGDATVDPHIICYRKNVIEQSLHEKTI